MKNIITVSREYGSGGYEIGQRVAREMGFTFYDKALITEIADQLMVSKDFIETAEHMPLKRNIFQEVFPIFIREEGVQADYIFNEQGKFIVKLAEKGNCVFAGRRADYYLRDNAAALHLFFYAEKDFKIARVMETDGLTEEAAAKRIEEVDRQRKTSYEYTTGRKWADRHNYDRMICTSSLGIDKCVEEIVHLLK